MIIYRAMPFKGYPIIIKSILDAVTIDSQEFWSILKPKNEEDYEKKISKNIMPKNLKHIRFDGFLYGAFDSQHLNLKKNDFIFTVINHPVDHIYEVYARINRLLIEYKNYSMDRNCPSMNWTCKFPFTEDNLKVSKENQILSEQEFIDSFLDEKEITISCDLINYKIIDEIIFGYDYKKFNYVGAISNLNKSCKKINDIFNKKIYFPIDISELSYIGNYYRKKDLEKLLAPQIDFYNSIK